MTVPLNEICKDASPLSAGWSIACYQLDYDVMTNLLLCTDWVSGSTTAFDWSAFEHTLSQFQAEFSPDLAEV